MNIQIKLAALQRRGLSLFLSLVIAFGLLISIPQPAMAGTGVKRLTKGKTVTTTLTGSKRHNVKYTAKDMYNNRYRLDFKLYIDGKVAYTYKSSYDSHEDANVWLLEVNNNTKLICISIDSQDEPLSIALKIFNYSAGKLRMCGDIHKLMNEKWGWGILPYPVKAGNNKLSISTIMQAQSIGVYDEIAKFNYSASNNKVSKASNINEVSFYDDSGWYNSWNNNWGTVAKSFNVYTKAGGSTLSFTAYVGNYLRVQRVTKVNGALYFEVKNTQGKVGWYKNQNDWVPYFREANYAS